MDINEYLVISNTILFFYQMPHYKLIYAEAKGLGEIIRMIFAQAGVDYEDVRQTKEQWEQLKPCKNIILLITRANVCARFKHIFHVDIYK